MRTRWRSVVAVGVVGVVGAACGGGGGGGDPVGGGGAPAGDTALARTIVLQQADMPQGWRAVPHTDDPTEADRNRQLSNCLGRPDPVTFRTAIVYGSDMSLGRSQVSSIATVLNTVQDALADLEATRGSKYGGCVSTAFRDDLQRQTTDARVDPVTAEALPVDQFGDGSVGLRLTTNLVYADHTDKLFADLVYMSKDRATVSATFFSFGEPFAALLEQSLVARLGNRVVKG